MSTEDSAWEAGDRVAVDDEGHPWHDSLGVVVGPDDQDEGAWLVRLDDGEEISAYTNELTGVVGPERYPAQVSVCCDSWASRHGMIRSWLHLLRGDGSCIRC